METHSATYETKKSKARSVDHTVKRTLFIVEDDEGMRELLPALVELLGWKARAFAGGPDCLEVVRGGEVPDCFLIDINMDPMTGPGLQAALAQLGLSVPVIMMTGAPTSLLAKQALAAGAREILSKPFNDRALEAALRRAASAN